MRSAIVSILLGCLLVAGCSVQPLYYAGVTRVEGTLAPGQLPLLSSVAVDPPKSREEQEVRNHLIFLMGGGAGQTATPHYTLDLRVTSSTASAVQYQTQKEEEPTAGLLVMKSNYRLTDIRTGKVVARGTRQITSPYDIPRQEFAVLRAVRDAENRAARELAELVRLSVAQQLAGLESR